MTLSHNITQQAQHSSRGRNLGTWLHLHRSACFNAPPTPPAVLAFIFIVRRVQPSLSLVDNEVEFCLLTTKLFSFLPLSTTRYEESEKKTLSSPRFESRRVGAAGKSPNNFSSLGDDTYYAGRKVKEDKTSPDQRRGTLWSTVVVIIGVTAHIGAIAPLCDKNRVSNDLIRLSHSSYIAIGCSRAKVPKKTST